MAWPRGMGRVGHSACRVCVCVCVCVCCVCVCACARGRGCAAQVLVLQQAAAQLAAESGLACDVLDLRSLAPWDEEAVCASVSKTGRLVRQGGTRRAGDTRAEAAARGLEGCESHVVKGRAQLDLHEAYAHGSNVPRTCSFAVTLAARWCVTRRR